MLIIKVSTAEHLVDLILKTFNILARALVLELGREHFLSTSNAPILSSWHEAHVFNR